MHGCASRLQRQWAINDQNPDHDHHHGSSMPNFRSRTRARDPCGQGRGRAGRFCRRSAQPIRTKPNGAGSPGTTKPTSTLLTSEDTTPAHHLGRTRIGSTRLKNGSPKGRIGLRSSTWQSRPFMPGPLPELPVISMYARSIRPSSPTTQLVAAARRGLVYRSTTPTMLARVNGLPDDQIGLAQADCCRFAARGGRFVGGRSRTGPLTWGGAEGI